MSKDADKLVATMTAEQEAQFREWSEWRNQASPHVLLDAVMDWWRISRSTPRQPSLFALRPGEGYLSMAAAEALLARFDKTQPDVLSDFGIACFILGLEMAQPWIAENGDGDESP